MSGSVDQGAVEQVGPDEAGPSREAATGEEAVPSCVKHPGQAGTPCERCCGTFACDECLVAGLCPPCMESSPSRPPLPEEAVGFSRRALGRIFELLLHQGIGFAAAVVAVLALAFLSGIGMISEAWRETPLEHGFGFHLLAGSTMSVVGLAASTWIAATTPGKALLGLRVVSVRGGPVRLGGALIRELAFFIDSLFFGLIAKGAMDSSPLQQRLGDRWGGTTVVRTEAVPIALRAGRGRLVIGISVGLLLEVLLGVAFYVLAEV